MLTHESLHQLADSLAAHAAQSLGPTPVWSTGATNTPSRRIAKKVGFIEVAPWTYLIPRNA